MRDELFKYYGNLVYSYFYEKLYFISARRIGNVYTGLLLLASAGGVVTLSIWDRFPIAWGVITFAAQILQALKPLLQATRQREALSYILQDKEDLMDEVSAYWNDVGAYEITKEEEPDVRNHIHEWQRKNRNTRIRFASGIDFPVKRRLADKAQIQTEDYFHYYYGVTATEE